MFRSVKNISFKKLWSRQSVRIGAGVTLLGGVIGTIANLNAVIDIFAPDQTSELVADTRTTVASADAKIDELLKLMRVQSALSGGALDPQSEEMIKAALEAILTSGDVRKASARKALEEGNVRDAAEAIAAVARQQADAAGGAARAAAESWLEAGALQAHVDPNAAILAFENARRLDSANLETWSALASLRLSMGELDAAQELFTHVRSNAAAGSADEGWALEGLGALAIAQGDFEEGDALLNEALVIAEARRDHALISVVYNNLGALARRRGWLDEADRLLTASLSAARAGGESGYEARALAALGLVGFSRGDQAKAIELMTAANAIYELRGELSRQATTLGNLGAFAIEMQQYELAEAYLVQSIEIGERLGLRQSVAEDLNNLADLALKRGDAAAAQRHVDRALTITESSGLTALTPFLRATSAEISKYRGDVATACALWADAVAGFAAMKDATGAVVASMAAEAGCDPNAL
ncbi:MAG: tetratricopeptide repeat protein [Pseudomonadota bacterium]|nr:tetratricopeptide repeat protein [Pseudomonadota bacterium]